MSSQAERNKSKCHERTVAGETVSTMTPVMSCNSYLRAATVWETPRKTSDKERDLKNGDKQSVINLNEIRLAR